MRDTTKKRIATLETARKPKDLSDVDLLVLYVVAIDKAITGAEPEALNNLPPPRKGSIVYEMLKICNAGGEGETT